MNDLPRTVEDALTCSAEAVAALRKLLQEKPSASAAKELSMAAARYATLLVQHELARRVEALENEADSGQG